MTQMVFLVDVLEMEARNYGIKKYCSGLLEYCRLYLVIIGGVADRGNVRFVFLSMYCKRWEETLVGETT